MEEFERLMNELVNAGTKKEEPKKQERVKYRTITFKYREDDPHTVEFTTEDGDAENKLRDTLAVLVAYGKMMEKQNGMDGEKLTNDMVTIATKRMLEKMLDGYKARLDLLFDKTDMKKFTDTAMRILGTED